MAGEILTIDAAGFVKYAPLAAGQLPTSGVTAGTYGDATDSARLTVDAAGRITAATTVPITGGGGSGGLVSLFDSTLGADAASIDTGATIPGGYAALQIVAYGNAATQNTFLAAQFNGDTGTNYTRFGVLTNSGGGGDAATGQTWAAFGYIGAGAGGSTPDGFSHTILMPGYASTVWYKRSTATGYSVVYATDYSCGWASTAAITQIKVFPLNGSNLKAGSRLAIYGF